VARALEEKHRLIAEILAIPPEDFDHVAAIATTESLSSDPADKRDRDAREVLLAALAQGIISLTLYEYLTT